MFGISFSEILLVLIISLLVFGPKQLPQIARTIGLLIYTLKSNFDNLKQHLYQETGIKELNKTKDAIANSCLNLKNQLNETFIQVKPIKKQKQSFEQPDLFIEDHD